MIKSPKLFIFIYYLLNCSWGIIQNTLAFIIFLFLILTKKRNIYFYNGAIVCEIESNYSCGLGIFIFLGTKNIHNKQYLLIHEYGHTIQSLILGPLFIPIIAIPSIIWALTPLLKRYRNRKRFSYYRFYPEAWANHLGNKVNNFINANNRRSFK